MWPADALLTLVTESLERRGPREALRHLLTALQSVAPDLPYAALLHGGPQGFLAIQAGDVGTRSRLATAVLQEQLTRLPDFSVDTIPLNLPPAAPPAVHSGPWEILLLPGENQEYGFLLIPPGRAGDVAEWVSALRLVLRHFQLLDFSGTRDYLTGLHSRRHLDAMLRNSLVLHGRHQIPFVFGMLDIDHFKDINDALGHAAGDEVLREIGKRLENASRGSDTVARYGGDEFAVILQHLGFADALVTIQRLHGRLQSFDVRIKGLSDIPVIPRISAGWIHIAADTPSPDRDALVMAADRLLYQAKDDPGTPWRCARYEAG